MGFRPPVPADMAIGYRNVMEACWQSNDSLRPTFDVILRCLQVSSAPTMPFKSHSNRVGLRRLAG